MVNSRASPTCRLSGAKLPRCSAPAPASAPSWLQRPPEQIQALANFGYNIGLAFQITDDILDLTADETQLGKTAGVDLAQGKGVASVQEDGVNSSGASLMSGGDLFAELRQKALEGNTIEEARLQAQVLMQQAVKELDALPPSAAVDDLIALARSTVERDS